VGALTVHETAHRSEVVSSSLMGSRPECPSSQAVPVSKTESVDGTRQGSSKRLAQGIQPISPAPLHIGTDAPTLGALDAQHPVPSQTRHFSSPSCFE